MCVDDYVALKSPRAVGAEHILFARAEPCHINLLITGEKAFFFGAFKAIAAGDPGVSRAGEQSETGP